MKIRASLSLLMLALCLAASCSTRSGAVRDEAPRWKPALVAAIRLDDMDGLSRVYSENSLPPDAAVNVNSVTPLMIASSLGSGEVVEWLLQHGAKVDACTTDKDPYEYPEAAGCTPLLMACAKGHSDIAKILLDHGASVSHQDSRGTTPLVVACARGHLATAKLLIERGADINFPTDATPLLRALQQDQPEVAEYLVSQGADVNAAFAIGRSVLMVASERGHASLVRLLLEKGADVNHTDDDGQHPLMEAAIEGRTEVTSLLLQRGAQIDLQDHAGWTALMQASASGFPETVKVLCEAGADPAKTNKFGRTAIEYARGIKGTSSLFTGADLTSAVEGGVFDHDELYYVLKRKGSGRDYAGVVRILETYEEEFHNKVGAANGSQPIRSETNSASSASAREGLRQDGSAAGSRR